MLLAILCDILFPWEIIVAASDGQAGKTTNRFVVSKKKNVSKRERSKSASKTEVTVRSCCKKQFEKKKLCQKA